LKRRILLLGPPASGKGTQAAALSTRFAVPHVSTGALLRAESAAETTLGAEADSWTSRGLLVPDDLIVRIVSSWIDIHGPSFILDGFPRTVVQAESLDSALASIAAPLDLVALLDLPEDAIRRRILQRLSCTRCGATFGEMLHGRHEGDPCPVCGAAIERRKDDTEETLGERLRVYRESTLPVVEHYRGKFPGIFHVLDAGEGSDVIFGKLAALVSLEDKLQG
jgi:adenylate kinase